MCSSPSYRIWYQCTACWQAFSFPLVQCCCSKVTFTDQHSYNLTCITQEHTAQHAQLTLLLQGVDIFSKDFLLIPIHDALHWSLIIVCHPGLDFESGQRKPYILHLDSMEGDLRCHAHWHTKLMQPKCMTWFVRDHRFKRLPILCLLQHLYHGILTLLCCYPAQPQLSA